MREIKFRGYCNYLEKWVYGYLVKSKYYRSQPILYSFIHTPHPKEHNKPSDKTMIDYKTIGQFTGLLDINGVEIYEGDRCTYEYKDFIIKGGGDTGHLKSDWLSNEGLVTWKLGAFRFELPNGLWIVLFHNRELEVIGNIYEKGNK